MNLKTKVFVFILFIVVGILSTMLSTYILIKEKGLKEDCIASGFEGLTYSNNGGEYMCTYNNEEGDLEYMPLGSNKPKEEAEE